MPLNWLCYRHNSDFTEGHELDRKSVERHCQRSAKLTI